jgi:beta-lactamase class A
MIKNKVLGCSVFLAIMATLVNTCLANDQQIIPSANQKKLADLEVSSGGRIGLFVINTRDNTSLQYHAKERFPMCSTSKVMAVAAILKQSTKDRDLLQHKIAYTKKDVELSGYAPITKNHIIDGLVISELCKAAITQSDNTAMNLLMKKLGGPEAVTSFAHAFGDNKFRLDCYEPELNSAIPGDLRDTTTPKAMTESLNKLAFGEVLELTHQDQLLSWLKGNKTGNARIRAGVPKGWLVADKTGTGSYGTTNDIGIIWPPKGSPIVVAIYFTQNKKDAAPRDDVIASVTRILINSLKIA